MSTLRLELLSVAVRLRLRLGYVRVHDGCEGAMRLSAGNIAMW